MKNLFATFEVYDRAITQVSALDLINLWPVGRMHAPSCEHSLQNSLPRSNYLGLDIATCGWSNCEKVGCFIGVFRNLLKRFNCLIMRSIKRQMSSHRISRMLTLYIIHQKKAVRPNNLQRISTMYSSLWTYIYTYYEQYMPPSQISSNYICGFYCYYAVYTCRCSVCVTAARI